MGYMLYYICTKQKRLERVVTNREAWNGNKVVRREDRVSKPRYLLPNGRWYNYNPRTPDRHRLPYPNLKGEIRGILSGVGVNRTKDFVLHTLRARGKYRYIINEEEVSLNIDRVRSDILHVGGARTRFVPPAVYGLFRGGVKKVSLGGITFVNVNVEDGLGVSVRSEVWGELRWRRGEGEWEESEEFRYRLWWRGDRERFYTKKSEVRGDMKIAYETQVEVIKTRQLQEEEGMKVEEIGSEAEGIEVEVIWSEFRELKVVYL